MARGRGGSDDFGVVTTRRRYMSVDPDLELGGSGRSRRIADYSMDDADVLSTKSRNKDRDLLNDITQRLHRVEFDGVKPCFDVAMKTGFRRRMYHKKLPLLEKETKENMKKDRLRYPWDHTSENMYRPVKHKREALDKYKKNLNKKTLKSYRDLVEEPPVELFPVYDPMGVYKTQPKREHVPLPDKTNKYDSMNMREKLAQMRAKLATLPTGRHASKDVDAVLDDLCRPLPQSLVAGQEMFTLDEDYDKNTACLDKHLSDKIKASRKELAEFDRLLNERFGTKKQMKMSDVLGRKRTVPKPPPPAYYKYDYDEEQRELGMQNGPTIAEPIVIHHVHAGPTARVVATPHGLRASYRVPAGTTTTGVRHRSSSLPPSPKGGSRRSRLADIETYYEDMFGYDRQLVDQVRPYQQHTLINTVVQTSSQASKPPQYPRMPSLDRHRPHQGTLPSAGNVAPYKPVSTHHRPPSGAGQIPRTTFRPKVSETRKRIREVMCATKKDPHYYE